MENTKQDQMRSAHSKKITRKTYGRVALGALFLALIKSSGIQLGAIFTALSDILIIIGVVCGIMWWIETRKLKRKTKL